MFLPARDRSFVRVGVLAVMVCALFLVASCGSDDGPTNPPPEENRAPLAATIDTGAGAPADAATDVAVDVTLRWACSDPDGDALEYEVRFGTEADPPAVATGQSGASYGPLALDEETTYRWRIVASDPDGLTTASPVWSFTTAAPATETVTVPDAPAGPGTGEVDEDLTYGVSGSTSSHGAAVEYQLAWGDGTTTDFGAGTGLVHAWSAAGTYQVTARARCADHPDVVSDWTAPLSVVIAEPGTETIGQPNAPSWAGHGETGQTLQFTTLAVTSSAAHDVEYHFDWGDGTMSPWSSLRYSVHPWSAAGTYEVRVQARCAVHNDILSPWSDATSVTITDPAPETVSAPDAPGVPAGGETDETLTVTVSGGASSDGHAVQHRVDFGDGTITSWYSSLTSIQHAWSAAGTYEVRAQARCATHTAIESDWSAAASLEITDPAEIIPTPPNTMTGVTDGAVDEVYEYNVFHSSVTNLGHQIEGRWDWGDGTTTTWTTSTDHRASHAWTAAGTYTVNYQARCSLHPEITADADPYTVTISEVASETVSAPGYMSFSTTLVTGETHAFPVYGGTSSLGHVVETRIDWGDGSAFSDWYPNLATVDKAYAAPGYYPLKRQSRCVEHPDVVSDWSPATTISVKDPETVSTPNAPDGPTSSPRGVYLYYTASGAESSWGHNTYIEYRFDWGDGSAYTDWSTETVQRQRYSALGDFEIRVQARCAFPLHDPIESAWSDPTVLSILETVSTSNYRPHGYENAAVGATRDFKAPYASSDVGHALEFQMDWNDGSTSAWLPYDGSFGAQNIASHAWSSAGVYAIAYRVRCAEHQDAVSDWSYTLEVAVTADAEAVSTPTASSQYSNVNTGSSVYIYGQDAVSNHGHDVEYNIDFGDGESTGWMPASGVNYSEQSLSIQHAFAAAGTYEVTCQARCLDHPGVVSEISAPRVINVSDP